MLALFTIYVVFYPRRRGKKTNRASYAEHCVSSVPSHYAAKRGRKPSLDGAGGNTHLVKMVVRALHKRSPTRLPRLPILQQHLRAIKTRMELKNSQWNRTLWALWLTQWQGVCVAGT